MSEFWIDAGYDQIITLNCGTCHREVVQFPEGWPSLAALNLSAEEHACDPL